MTSRAAARPACLALAALASLALPARGGAQIPDTAGVVPVDSVIVEPQVPVEVVPASDRAPEPPMSPRGAFIRSMILPGWGQAAFESYVRGGVYYAGWAGNWLALFNTQTKLTNARSRFERRQDQLQDSLVLAAGGDSAALARIDDPVAFEQEIRADSLANDLRMLVRAREEQREDWIAWSLFWILASGIDGYVTAHLYDFPAAIHVEPNADRSVSLRLEVPLPRRRP